MNIGVYRNFEKKFVPAKEETKQQTISIVK
jgi:hypothetical protein